MKTAIGFTLAGRKPHVVRPWWSAAVSAVVAGTLVACGGQGQEQGLTDTRPTPASVKVTPTNATLTTLGQTVQLTATVRDASGNPISGQQTTWTSSDASVASVSTLGLEGVLPPSPAPTAISCGNVLAGSITQPGEADLYTFAGTVGDIITMTIVETTDWGGSVGANDAQVTLFSPAGAQLTFFDSNGQLEFTLPTTGTYLIRVTANNLVSTGSYDVGLQCL